MRASSSETVHNANRNLTTKSTDDHVAPHEQVLAEEKPTLPHTGQQTHTHTLASQIDGSTFRSQWVLTTSPDPTQTKELT